MDPNSGKRTLANKLSREELLAKLEAETFERKTLSFYKYVIIQDPKALRDELFAQWSEWDCLGRIYVSREGINAQMNVPAHHWEAFEQHLHGMDYFKDVPFKMAVTDKTDGKSFLKLIIKVRDQIVADGLQPEDYDVTDVGATSQQRTGTTPSKITILLSWTCAITMKARSATLKGPSCRKLKPFAKNCPWS